MRYFGSPDVPGCKETKQMIDRCGLPYEFVDIRTLQGWQGSCPQLELDNGMILVGISQIHQYLNDVYGCY